MLRIVLPSIAFKVSFLNYSNCLCKVPLFVLLQTQIKSLFPEGMFLQEALAHAPAWFVFQPFSRPEATDPFLILVLSSNLLLKAQLTLTSDWVAQGFVQSALGNLQGWRSHSTSGQPAPLVDCPHGEKVFPSI